MITRKKVDIEDEKKIAIGCIVSDHFLRDILPLLNDLSLLKSSYIKSVISWCIDYYKRYEKAPQEIIQDIFETKKKYIDREEYVNDIKDLLVHLNETYLDGEEFNAPYYFDKAQLYLKEKSLELLMSNINGLLKQGKIKEAEHIFTTYNRLDKSMGTGTDLLNDDELIADMFNSEEETLFSVPGAFGDYIKSFYRGDIAIVGAPSKRGKTFILIELSKYALLDHLNVLYISLEMKTHLMAKRIYQNLIGESKYQMTDFIDIPYFDKDNNIQYEQIKKDGLTREKTIRFREKFKKHVKKGRFKMLDPISGGCSVEEIIITLDNLAYYDDFVPDVIVLDYADIMAKDTDMKGSPLEITNEIYLRLKREIAQKRNCLLLSASQHNRQSIGNDSEISNIAGNVRKYDHVSHWISLNQTKEEKAAGCIRIHIEGRHDEFEPIDQVVCLQSLAIGRPILDSRWKKEISNYEEIIEGVE